MQLPTFLPAVLVLLALPTSTTAAPTTSCGRRNTARYCEGTNYTTSLLQTYLCGDSRLGPTRLPHGSDDLPVSPVLAAALYGYDRFGGLCPGEFVAQFFDPVGGWWRYPPQNGFLLTTPEGAVAEGPRPIQGNVTLAEETLIDRFGSEWGSYVTPAGATYAARALPPSNLVGNEVEYPFNYHIYSVVKPLMVLAGPIAPWFGQPGAGTQYMLYQNVKTLIEEGFLRREDPSVMLA
ncbi:hypothetical protein N658DRAFT_88597 [Parathielavia hyrcaniae]|uniref:TNT domain-containing protein n=1 Tax=Parathielavia hyrcaniae TaxID=113614 RepID=A0AAN6Q293_9PEZI|nr:hypothetical protein N658DRAFT_88597 [Parathielavia hyrcaniae]